MTTEFVSSPNDYPNRVSTGSGKGKLKPSNERSYLKSRRSQHRTEKRQTILNFLDKNLGGSSSSNIDHRHHHSQNLGSSKGSLDKTPGSPTQRRRNVSNASTAKTSSLDSCSSGLNASTTSDLSNLDGSFTRDKQKQQQQQQQRSRWNPFLKRTSSSEQPALTTDSPTRDGNNSHSSGSKSRSRRSANRQRLAEHLSQERKQQQQEDETTASQQQQLNESYHTQESQQQHQQILDRVLKAYPKHSCHNAEDHLMFATAELTMLQNKLHLPQATFKLLKIKLKDRLDAQEADAYLRKQHEEQHIGGRTPQLTPTSPKSHRSRRSKGPQVKRIVSNTTESDSDNHHHHHHHHRRPSSPTKSKSAPSSAVYNKVRKNDEPYGINNDHESKINTIREEQTGHSQHQSERRYGEEALKDGNSNSNSHRRNSTSKDSPKRDNSPPPDSNRSLAVSTKSLVVPKQRPPSCHTLKTTDKDDTSRTTLEDDDDDDVDPAAASAVASLLKYVEEKFMEDGNGHRGTYTGPIDQQSGLPHGTAGKMEYNHSHNHKYDNYQGEWYKGLFTGSGTLLKTNGDVYHGQFMDGVYHGKGHYQYYHSSRHFSGRHVQGQRVEGTMTYKDGSIYKGQFYKGKRHGRGQYTFQDSSVYKGEFSEDKLHGIGQLTWPDGSKYIGEWSNGVRHGTGKECKADGSLRFQGRWKDGNEVRD